ncbi:unnamed protein product [Pseudo-nitzschia multistriata]|uniref:Uncharacterized protein n=1 Tax=Pseudo-nitzschia multistriata TaxID=183589 RepID=A0A448Z0T8_9STRA|nr:unnamed protein product [Pseudo-nitzschia multistriata]
MIISVHLDVVFLVSVFVCKPIEIDSPILVILTLRKAFCSREEQQQQGCDDRVERRTKMRSGTRKPLSEPIRATLLRLMLTVPYNDHYRTHNFLRNHDEASRR